MITVLRGSTRIYGLVAGILCLINSVQGIAIDNEVIGIPQVQCSEDAVTFAVRSRNPFTGNIYIKGKFNEPSCRQEFFSNTFNGASYTVRIPLCGMRRIRQLQPQGMNYILVFVVNFHPQFNTKIDRAYNVRCFYAQQEKTVTSLLEVSMMSTQSLEAATMLMPNCEYSIRSGSLNGPRVRYVRVGDRLVHRWECDNPNFGMLVKNCFVNDGYGSSVRVLDSRGCPVFTPVIQGPLQYDNSLNLAYVEVWAYKFPDRQDLYFQCQVQVCNKRENECVGVTPPNCPLLPQPGVTPSIVQPGITPGPFGTVTFVRGTFAPPFGGQEVVIGPYQPQPGPFVPQPAPYGPPFGQQVLPGYVPGGQPVSIPSGVVQPGPVANPYGVASEQGPNARGVPGVANEQGPNPRGGSGAEEGAIQQRLSAPQSVNRNLVGQPRQEIGQAQRQQPRIFNSEVRNDDSDQRLSANGTEPNSTSLAVQPSQFGTYINLTQHDPRLRRQKVIGARKSRREAEHEEDENEFDGDDYDSDHSSITDPGPVEIGDSTHSNLPPQGDGELMDVTADVVYVADVGDNDLAEDPKRSPFASVSTGETKQVCLNSVAFSLLFSSFAVLVIIIALLLFYLLMRSGRWHHRADGGHDGIESTSNSKMDSTPDITFTNDSNERGNWMEYVKNKLPSILQLRLRIFNRKRLHT